jgi:hypothetical protein
MALLMVVLAAMAFPSLGIPPLNLTTARVTYRFNGQQVAVREGVTLTFIYGDHLGSASVTANISGMWISERCIGQTEGMPFSR